LVIERSLIIVSGKGGVGKSAVSAAIALLAQRAGKKVLVLAMSPGPGLAAHLGIGSLDYEPIEVRPGLYAAAIDRAKALTEYLQAQMGVPRMARFGPLARAFDALASTAPGIREVITMGKVLYEVRQRRWDLVVADAPPTGQIGSHLVAPRTVADLVPTGRIKGQAGWMDAILGDPERSGLLLVTLAEELPVNETRETLAWLDEHPVIDVLPPVVNRVLPKLEVTAATMRRLEPGPVHDAAQLHRSLYVGQQEWLDELPPGPRLPYLFGLNTPGEVAVRLSDLLESA
jgi:anion-transporting  ArsA/GET3 family ATPase